METDRKEKPEYVTCVEGADESTVDIVVKSGDEAVVGCDTVIDGCLTCSASKDKTQVTCNTCKHGHFLTKA